MHVQICRLVGAFFGFFVILTPHHRLAAATFNWNNAAGNWSNSPSWGGTAPTGLDPLDILNFGGAGPTIYTATNDVANPFRLNQIVLASTASVTNIIAGSQVQFAGSGAAVTQNGSGAFTISAPLNIAVGAAFDGTGSGTVGLSGQLSGSSTITKSSSGTLDIFNVSTSTPNTFAGAFNITAGTLLVHAMNSPLVAAHTLRANAVTLGASATFSYTGTSAASTLADLRLGEIGGSGSVSLLVGNGLVLTTLADALSSGTVTAGGTGGGTVALAVRGVGTQTFTGNTTGIVEPVSVYRGAGLTLAGSGTTSGVLANTTNVTLNVLGGTITLDNSAANTTSAYGRLAASTALAMGGGKFAHIGHADGSTEGLGGLTLNAGSNTISVTNNGTGAALAFSDTGSLRDSTAMVVNFAGAGAGTLGAAGNNPRITFSGSLNTNTTNGMLSNSISATAATIGWATVNGTSWAGVGANGIVALTDQNRTSVDVASATAWELTNLQGSATLSSSLTVGALKLSPTASGQSLAIGTNNLATTAVMLAGTTDYAITGTGTLSGGATRYIYVADPNATLTTSMIIGSGSSNPTNKAGAGFLVLNGVAAQNMLTNTARLNLLDGTLRGNNTQLGFTSSGTGIITFRGGVLEISDGVDGTGTSADFRRALGTSASNTNWDTGAGDTGSGGFSAIGGNASVNLGGTASPSVLTWGMASFVQTDYALVFGSTKSNARIRLLNPLTLDSAVGPYQARNIQVIDNPDSTADYAQLAGAVVSSLTADLLKTGAGSLELAANNTGLTGGVIVTEGTLLIGNNGALGSSAYVMVGARGGSANASLLHNGAFATGRNLSVIGGNTGVTSIGGNTDDNSSFSGTIELQKAAKLVSVTTGANAVIFSGEIYGAFGLTVDGGGTVALNATNTFGGAGRTLAIRGGSTLLASANGNLGASNTGLSFDNGTLKFGAAFDPSGRTVTINAGGATINTNGTNVTFANVIGNSGTGGLTKTGAGTLTLAGGNYTGATAVSTGTLQVNGNLTASSGVTLAATTTLTGTGSVAALSGAGKIAPGVAGAGILTTGTLNALAGTDFDFQFTQTGSPTYGSPTASGNDVLVITAGIVPTLTAANVINVYLTMADPDAGGVFRGGFFTTSPDDFVDNLNGATINYFINSTPIAASQITSFTVAENGGEVWSIGVTPVPEPGALVLATFTTPILLRRRLRR